MLNTSNSTEMANSDNYQDVYDYNMTNSSDYDGLSSGFCEPGDHEFTIRTFQSCAFCLIFLLGVVGNCLVIATFALYRRLHLRSMTDVFLFHLALANLLLLLTLPLQAVDTYTGWIFDVPLCKATRASYAINTYSGLLLLACISVDRYLVVAQAHAMLRLLAHAMLRLRTQILTGGKVAAVGVWMVAVLLSLPEILFSGVSPDAYCGIIATGKVKMATNGAIIGVFCLSFSIMVVCYSLIARALWEGRRGKPWHRQRTLKLMVALVLVFLLFQLPYTVVLLRKMAEPLCALLLEYITCTLAYARCCLNPILYALVGVRFRHDVLRLIHGSARSAHKAPQSVSGAFVSSSVLTMYSPTSTERSHSGNETRHPIKFFPQSA